jgi:hypothetical protein
MEADIKAAGFTDIQPTHFAAFSFPPPDGLRPSQLAHRIRMSRTLFVLNPDSIGRAYFEEIAEAVSGPGKPDPARLKEIMLRHGLVPA